MIINLFGGVFVPADEPDFSSFFHIYIYILFKFIIQSQVSDVLQCNFFGRSTGTDLFFFFFLPSVFFPALAEERRGGRGVGCVKGLLKSGLLYVVSDYINKYSI